MMEKLLHERLREVANEYGWFRTVDEEQALQIDFAKALADEIERCYIPRPRFEDGEPIKEGDPFVQKFRDEEAVLSRIGIALYTDDGLNAVWFPDEVVSRPTPKVYDADGVEIKRNDRVYPIEKKCNSDTEGYIVNHIEVDEGINSPRVYFIDDVCMSWMKADQLTHERPVFDAEGVRICKGDTVWTLHTGNKFTVDGFTDDGAVIVRFGEDSDDLTTYAPKGLIHHETDSLEKLRDDMKRKHEEWDSDPNEWLEMADRLTALIDSGA